MFYISFQDAVAEGAPPDPVEETLPLPDLTPPTEMQTQPLAEEPVRAKPVKVRAPDVPLLQLSTVSLFQ